MRRPNPILLLLACAALMTTACGASQREKTLRATVIAVNAARDGFVPWDLKHQRSIYRGVYERGGTKELALAELAAYRKKREPVVELFIAAYRAIGVAAVLNEDDRSLAAALEAAAKLKDALFALMGAK